MLPLFPGYLFCRLAHTAAGLVLTTPGTIRIVSFGGKPYPISEAEIEAIRRMCSSGRVSPFPHFKEGESVRIKDGPLAGITGVLKEMRNQQRLIVTVDFIMKSVAVEIDGFAIERLITPQP